MNMLKKFGIPIYKLKNIGIEIINKWNKNQFVEGYLERENKKLIFVLKIFLILKLKKKKK